MSEKKSTSSKRGGARPGAGRKPGQPNKLTAKAKEAIEQVASQLGGPDRMVAWVKEDPLNERVFWKDIYPKLLPLQVTGKDGDAIQHAIRVTFG